MIGDRVVDIGHGADIVGIGSIKPLVDLVAAVIRCRRVQKGDLPRLAGHHMGVDAGGLKVGTEDLDETRNIGIGSGGAFLVVGGAPVPLGFVYRAYIVQWCAGRLKVLADGDDEVGLVLKVRRD